MFHRTLYVFYSDELKDKEDCIKVYRCQLPIQNSYFKQSPPNYKLVDIKEDELRQKYSK